MAVDQEVLGRDRVGRQAAGAEILSPLVLERPVQIAKKVAVRRQGTDRARVLAHADGTVRHVEEIERVDEEARDLQECLSENWDIEPDTLLRIALGDEREGGQAAAVIRRPQHHQLVDIPSVGRALDVGTARETSHRVNQEVDGADAELVLHLLDAVGDSQRDVFGRVVGEAVAIRVEGADDDVALLALPLRRQEVVLDQIQPGVGAAAAEAVHQQDRRTAHGHGGGRGGRPDALVVAHAQRDLVRAEDSERRGEPRIRGEHALQVARPLVGDYGAVEVEAAAVEAEGVGGDAVAQQ